MITATIESKPLAKIEFIDGKYFVFVLTIKSWGRGYSLAKTFDTLEAATKYRNERLGL